MNKLILKSKNGSINLITLIILVVLLIVFLFAGLFFLTLNKSSYNNSNSNTSNTTTNTYSNNTSSTPIILDNSINNPGHFHEGLCKFSVGLNENMRFGFFDKSGKIVINPIYKSVSNFYENLCAAQNETDKYGFIDHNGNVIVDFLYDDPKPFSEDLACVKKGDKYGYIDKQGNVKIDFIFDSANSFSDGIAIVTLNGKYAYLNKQGKVAHINFFPISAFHEGYALIYNDNKYGFINKNLKIIIPPQFDDAKQFINGIAYVKNIGSDGLPSLSHFINPQGEEVIPGNDISDASTFVEGLSFVTKYSSSSSYKCYIDTKGNEVFKYTYDEPDDSVTYSFCEGLLPVLKNGKYGYIDKTGKLVIDCKFDQANSFNEGLARIELDGKKDL